MHCSQQQLQWELEHLRNVGTTQLVHPNAVTARLDILRNYLRLDKLSISVVVVVVHWVPVRPADVAELLAASASHLIAALAPFHNETALFALSVLEVVI